MTRLSVSTEVIFPFLPKACLSVQILIDSGFLCDSGETWGTSREEEALPEQNWGAPEGQSTGCNCLV